MKPKMIKILMAIIIVPVLSYLGYMGYLAYLAPKPVANAATIEPKAVETGPKIVSAEGKVLPSQYVQMSFKTPGLVEEVPVAQGDRVEKGQLIARLEGQEQLESAITTAKFELISAEKNLDELYEHADLRRAQAQQAVIEAQDTADKAERLLNGLTTPATATEEQIEAAEASVTLAEKELARVEKRLQDLLNRPPGSPERAAAELALMAAKRRYQEAVSYRNALKSEPNENNIARAEANLAVAQAQLEEAKREYEILQNGLDPDEVALAEARVANAEAQLAAAETAFDDLKLVAPFSGEIISLTLKVGEVVNPGVPAVTIADLSSWQVETIDLPENDVSLIKPGMKAIITLNAFPDKKFSGVVKEIDLRGVESRGAVTYVVTLDFDPKDVSLRWEMSAFVEILLP